MNAKLATMTVVVGLLGTSPYQPRSCCDGGEVEACTDSAGEPTCDDPTTAPEPEPAPRVIAIAAGDEHSCAISEEGELRCWGNGRYGRLGYGGMFGSICESSGDEFTCVSRPQCCVGDDETPTSEVPIVLLSAVARVSAGVEHTCAILDEGELRCWGRNVTGQLGLAEGAFFYVGDDESPVAVPPIDVGAPALDVAAGGAHTCAVLEGGALRCWGSNERGLLGHGDTSFSACAQFDDYKCFTDPACCVGDDELPSAREPVELGGAAISVAASAVHTCAVLEGGALRCWGDDSFGQLGYGGASGSLCLDAEMRFSCDADPSCCVGDDEVPAAVEPVSVGGAVVQVSTGSAYSSAGELMTAHTCAVLEGGALRCWGDNAYGQLGYGHTDSIGDDERPGDVDVVDVGGPVVQVAAGASHTCALLEGGDVRCWGDNSSGQLGLGHKFSVGDDEPPSAAPPVNLGGAATQIAVGGGPPFWYGGAPRFGHACALLEDGAVRCWGGGTVNNGQLGYGDTGGISCLINSQVPTSFSCSTASPCCVGDEPDDMPPEPVDAFD
ncbi:MAG: hypothetical protein KC468_03365 [Myxococcales bacterium]|nr:hypothetical protein [Myxococcales bacterium]